MTGAHSLPCGTDPDALLAQVADGHGQDHDAHQRQCRHCRAALAEYGRLWAPFDELAATEVRAPEGLLDEALAAIRDRAGPPGYGRVEADGATILVAARAVVAVAGHAARTSAGVRMALGALGELLDPVPGTSAARSGVDAGVSGQSVAVELTVAAEYGHDLQRLAEHVRERVAAEVFAQTGLETISVDITISDVFPRLDPPPTGAG